MESSSCNCIGCVIGPHVLLILQRIRAEAAILEAKEYTDPIERLQSVIKLSHLLSMAEHLQKLMENLKKI